jgi:hypothetical protein
MDLVELLLFCKASTPSGVSGRPPTGGVIGSEAVADVPASVSRLRGCVGSIEVQQLLLLWMYIFSLPKM